MSRAMWGIHTRDEQLFLRNDVIAIGWSNMGDLSEIEATREAYKIKYAEAFPGKSKQSIANCAGMLFRFAVDTKIGDYIIFPSSTDRMINIGEVASDYYYDEEGLKGPHDYVQRRKIKWLKHIPRTSFSQQALYALSAQMSYFSIRDDCHDEFMSALDPSFAKVAKDNDTDDTIGATAKEIKENTKDFIIKALMKNLKGYPLEEFVANLLEVMGYKPKVSQHGGDRGIDIVAYRDELPPRIVVQVKSVEGDIPEDRLLALKGAMEPTDYGLFVTLSNYSKNALDFLERHHEIRGINGEELSDLIMIHYDELDDKYKDMIPMERVYIPVPKEEDEDA